MKRCLPSGRLIKSSSVQSQLFALANTYTESGPCTVPQRVSPHVSVAFTAFAVGPLRKYLCNNVQAQRVVDQ